MSLEYSVYLTTPSTPAAVEERLSAAAGVEGPRPVASGEPVRRSARALHPLTQLITEESYGFRPTVGVVYPLNKHLESEVRERGALESIATLLRVEPGDAYVDFSGLKPALLRRAGHVTVNSEWLEGRAWVLARLAALFGPNCDVGEVPEPT